MKKKPLVSIIMNCFNGEKYLNSSLNSIIKQDYKNWELIFWDNKSTDNTFKILKSFDDKRIRYFRAKKRTVLYEARNFAIEKAKGEFIAFLDVDDFWTKDKLRKQIPKFRDRKIGLVYSNFYKYNDFKKKKYIAYDNKLPQGHITSSIIKNYQIGFLTIVLRKKFLKKHKIFDFKYDLLSDYNFVLNFSLKHSFACLNSPLAFYRIHDNQLQKNKMVSQARQFCRWFKNERIKKKFNKYDLSSIYKKLEYYDLLKDLDGSKVNLLCRMLKNFNLINFLKINALIFFPKRIIFKFIDNL
tara:strand:- start:186 stop:1079 length:894 start_codon:yes stop_codon:yes gene_type:complete